MDKLNITKITVLIAPGRGDYVSILTDLPSPFPKEVDSTPLSIRFDAPKGKGVEYVREHFGIEPEVIKR